MDKTIEIPKLTILTEEQVYGNNKLNIFNVIDPRAAVSDTAILRGAFVSDYHTANDNSLSGRTGSYWLQNSLGSKYAYAEVVTKHGYTTYYSSNARSTGIRAALPYSQIKNFPHTLESSLIYDSIFGSYTSPERLEVITYGYYPGAAVDNVMQQTLEAAYNSKTLKKLEVGYTFDGRKCNDYNKDFSPEKQECFVFYDGKLYTRIKANFHPIYGNHILSNGEEYKDGDYVWVKIEPIVWLKHPLDDVMISEKEILAGVRFSELKWFLDNYLSKDILSLYELKKYINKNNYSDDEIKTINNFIYLNENGNPIKKKKIIVKAKRKSN